MSNPPMSDEVFRHTLNDLARSLQAALETAQLAPCQAALTLTDGDYVISMAGRPRRRGKEMHWHIEIETMQDLLRREERRGKS